MISVLLLFIVTTVIRIYLSIIRIIYRYHTGLSCMRTLYDYGVAVVDMLKVVWEKYEKRKSAKYIPTHNIIIILIMITLTTVTLDRCANFDIENANWHRHTNPMQWLQYLPIPISVYVLYSYTQTILLHIYYTLVVAFKSVFYFYLFLIAPPCARKKPGESRGRRA